MTTEDRETFDVRCQERREALQKLIDVRSCKVDEKLRHLQDLFDHRLAATEKALVLQAAEYERRLDDLNHERARELQERGRTLPREIFEGFHREYDEFRRKAETELAAAHSRATTWTAAVALAFTILTLALHFFK